MRGARLLLAVMAALAAGACARAQKTTYVIDPSTGQPVPVVSQQTYAQPDYAQPQAALGGRGLFTARQSAAVYAPQTYAQQRYAQQFAQPQYAAPQVVPHGEVPLSFPLRPGDTVTVKERWF
jgi:hypothetical protein